MRSLKVLAITTNHYDLFDCFLLHRFWRLIPIEVKILIVVELKIHSRSHKGIGGSSFPNVAHKYLPAVQFFPQIEYLPWLVGAWLEVC
jgi:hypothetical protein